MLAPVFAVVALVHLLSPGRPATHPPQGADSDSAEADVSSPQLAERALTLQRALEELRPSLSALQARVDQIGRELAELHKLAAPGVSERPARPASEERRPPDLEPQAEPVPVPVPVPGHRASSAARPAIAPAPHSPARPRPARRQREVDLAELLGARALAWAGGIVTRPAATPRSAPCSSRGTAGGMRRARSGPSPSLSGRSRPSC